MSISSKMWRIWCCLSSEFPPSNSKEDQSAGSHYPLTIDHSHIPNGKAMPSTESKQKLSRCHNTGVSYTIAFSPSSRFVHHLVIMRKLTDKRKSVSMVVLNDLDDEEVDAVHPLPSPRGRRRSVFARLTQPKQPSKEKRRFSTSTSLLGTSTPVPKNSFFVSKTFVSRKSSSEVDYLPGLSPLSDEVPISRGFADGWDFRIVFHTENPKYAVGRKTQPDISSEYMGRAMRVVVAGARRVGKTAILKQVACVEDITHQQYEPTIDDTYQVLLEEADRPREILIFHDTGGIPDYGPVELKKAYLQVADAFVLVYSVSDHESFNRVDLLRKFIEQHHSKEKKEVPIVVLGNMRDQGNRKVDPDFAHAWAAKAKVKLFEVTAKDRNSLVDFVHYLGQRHFHPIKESKFSLSKKLKPEKSNAIMMDF